MEQAKKASDLLAMLEALPDDEKEKFYASLVEDFPEEIEEAKDEVKEEKNEEVEEATEEVAEEEAKESEEEAEEAKTESETEMEEIQEEAEEEMPEEQEEQATKVNDYQQAIEQRFDEIEAKFAQLEELITGLAKGKTVEETAKEIYGIGNGVFSTEKTDGKKKVDASEIGAIVRNIINH